MKNRIIKNAMSQLNKKMITIRDIEYAIETLLEFLVNDQHINIISLKLNFSGSAFAPSGKKCTVKIKSGNVNK